MSLEPDFEGAARLLAELKAAGRSSADRTLLCVVALGTMMADMSDEAAEEFAHHHIPGNLLGLRRDVLRRRREGQAARPEPVAKFTLAYVDPKSAPNNEGAFIEEGMQVLHEVRTELGKAPGGVISIGLLLITLTWHLAGVEQWERDTMIASMPELLRDLQRRVEQEVPVDLTGVQPEGSA